MTAPVLILTARDDPQHCVLGLDAGGDDYLGKPFNIAELEAGTVRFYDGATRQEISCGWGR